MITYISTKEKLSKRMQYIRKWHKYSQQEIADYLGIDRSTYAYYETMKTIPDIFTLIKLSEFYNIDIRYFLLTDNKIIKQNLKQLHSKALPFTVLLVVTVWRTIRALNIFMVLMFKSR